MVKKCAVKNCTSGCAAERRVKSKLNLRQTALFKVPECPNTLQKWNLALSQKLVHKNFVCELHFEEGDILNKYDGINLPNGEVFNLPRVRFDLKPGAIPSLKDNTSNVDGLPAHSSNDTNYSSMQVTSELMITEEVNDINISDDPLYEECNTSNDLSGWSKPILNSTIIEGTLKDVHHMKNVEFGFEEQFNLKNNCFGPTEDTLDTPNIFTLPEIIQALEDQGVPQNWCWPKQLEPQKELILYYVDIMLKKLKLEIKISIDLTIMITIMETGVCKHYNYALTSVVHFFDMLRDIEKCQFCAGAGVNSKRCSTTCVGILRTPEKYKRYQRVNRCFACRSLRKKLLPELKKKKT